jgi:DNA-binding NarL/FixJ family response regulator
MIRSGIVRPRVLVADGDPERRARMRRALGDEFVLAEAAAADEALVWLEDQAPGLTLADFRLPGAAGAELVARIRDLAPHELVLILAPDPSLGLCRAAMRAGAYDCLDPGSLLPEQLRASCEAALARLEEAARGRRVGEDLARGAVRRHEREAASRLAKPEAVAAWKAVDVAARERWVHDYLQAVESPAAGPDRERCIQELAFEIGAQTKPGELLIALHVHAVASARPSTTDEAMDRARDCLVAALVRVADARAARAGGAPAAGPGSPRPTGESSVAWHRWRLSETEEEWTLVVGGRPLARLVPNGSGCRAQVRAMADGDRLDVVDLPPVPEALREVERRLGLPYVLNVQSAKVG